VSGTGVAVRVISGGILAEGVADNRLDGTAALRMFEAAAS
jgi:hypothetical protein